ncbi:hypothetical protein [Azospirillum halopraeferens]|uniref:hypothetical protein n=1 Tax=Azospirillum halopraeferens TaxID=34010 RepID=UPI000411DB34|nr:hypothetical protein [Azospirillum halopraeferens]
MLTVLPADTLIRERHGHAWVLREAAERAGIPTRVVAADTWPRKCGTAERNPKASPWLCLPIGAEVFFFRHHGLSRGGFATGPAAPVNGTAGLITKDKQETGKRLAAAGIPTPPGRVFAAADRAGALLYAAQCRGELCVKPNSGALGDLVFPGLRTAQEIDDAFRMVAAHYDAVLVERSMPGHVWRFFYVEPAVVGVKFSRPASVLGDGISSVAALIDAKHRERAARRVVGHFDIPEGHARTFMLARQGLHLDSVPAAGRRVFLHPTSNGASGADSISRPGAVHPGYRAMMERACAAIPGLKVAALDVMITDPAQPPTAGTVAVLEINAKPGLLPYHYPWEGPPQDVAGAVIGLLQRIAVPCQPMPPPASGPA